MSLLPVFIDLNKRNTLVVGAGEVAARKIERLLRCQASITVVAPTACASVKRWETNRQLRYLKREFLPEDLDNQWLVYAATNNEALNRRVATLAKSRRLLTNVVDDPQYCDFLTPSILDRGPVQIAIGTGGASPVLARLLRARLETLIPAGYGDIAEVMSGFRSRVKERIRESRLRRRFWEQVLSGPIAEMLFAGQRSNALAALDEALSDFGDDEQRTRGEVYLVGAGPGDPDLLTFRALRLMQQADIVFYDRLVSRPILDLVRRDAERVYVGKASADHAIPQEGINSLLVEHASAGKRVLRLKGGDPFIFGRGGEEIEELAQAGIAFQIVPGITAASGCASYAGIPLTHRDHAQSVVFVTAHPSSEKRVQNFDSLVQTGQTIVAYMGLKALPEFCTDLISHGLPPDTPAALVERGTQANQRVLVSDCENLPALAMQADFRPPSLIIIGSVVSLQSKLAWFGEALENETV